MPPTPVGAGAGPIDKAGGLPVGSSQLSTFSPQVFGVVPLAAAVLGCTVGVTTGLFIKRIIPAMAVALALFAAALVAMPQFIAERGCTWGPRRCSQVHPHNAV